jgi:hypothetical protein
MVFVEIFSISYNEINEEKLSFKINDLRSMRRLILFPKISLHEFTIFAMRTVVQELD